MRDRYEGRPRGHSFGATHSGITLDNKPILELLTDAFEDYPAALARIKVLTGRSGSSVSGCIRGLRRHGLVELESPTLGVPARIRRSAHAREML